MKIYIMFLAIVFSLSVNAQRRMDFDIIAGNKGLSENVINSIIQDKNGFIWFATNDGLNRYDGYNITQYRYNLSKKNTLSSNVVTALCVDSKGLIWIGTSDNGLNCYDPNNNTFLYYKNYPSDAHSISSGMIDEIVEDNEGNLWINIRNKGIDVLMRGENNDVFMHYTNIDIGGNYSDILNSSDSFKITASSTRGVWITSSKGIQKIIAGNKKEEDISYLKKIATTSTVSIKEFESGDLVIIHQDGEIIRGNKKKNDFEIKSLLHTSPFEGKVSLDIDKKGCLWIADANGLQKINGKDIFHYSKGGTLLNNMPTNRILSLHVDNSNVLWVGTYNYGALSYDLDSELYYNFEDLRLNEKQKSSSFFSNAVHSICEDKFGAIWIGSEGGGLMRIRNGLSAFINNNSNYCDFIHATETDGWLIDNNIYSMYTDSKGRLWIGCGKGLLKVTFKTKTNPLQINKSTIQVEKYFFDDLKIFGEGAIFVIREDNHGTIWIARWNGGLHRYDENKNKFTGYYYNPSIDGSLPYNTVRDILFENNDEAWLATAGGGLIKLLYRDGYDTNPYFVTVANTSTFQNSISNNYILNLAKDNNGNLWMGTFGGGINQMSKNKDKYIFSYYSTDNCNIPSNTIKGLTFDNHNKLWVTTNRHLFRMSPVNNNIEHVVKSQKFNIEEFKDNAIYKFKSGFIMLGGINGIVLFEVNQNNNKIVSPLQPSLTNLYINNQQVDVVIKKGDELKLPKDQNTIELSFSAMYFKGGGDIIYSIYLEGYDKEPIITTNNSVRYTQLPHGKYHFKLKASIDGINWSTDDLTFSVVIMPPFWSSWYAYTIYVALFITGIFGAYKIVIFRIRYRNRINIENIKRCEIEKSHNLKMQFFTNISHELRTPLNLIINPIDSLLIDKTMDKRHEDMLKLMQHNSLRLNKLINQLLDFRKMESGMLPVELVDEDIISFIYHIFKSFEDMALRRNINYRFSCDITTLKTLFDPDKIEKILYNLLSNAFKFTVSNDSVILSLKQETEELLIEVIDTGIGIKEEEQNGIFQYFYQASHSKQYIGSGIGLAYVKNLVKSFGGSIGFTSEYGTGSRFTLRLSIDRKKYEDYPLINHYAPKESEFLKQEIAQLDNTIDDINLSDNQQTKANKTILIVDDNKELLSYLSIEFGEVYHIITAFNGQEGLTKAKEQLPDIIVSDLMMPQMDGLEMCKILKTDLSTCHIPIIILTAKNDESSELEGLEIGADQYLLKPIKTEVLRLKIKNILTSKEELHRQISLTVNSNEFKDNSNKNEKEFLDRIEAIVKRNVDESDLDIEKLSSELGMSRSALYKKIKLLTNMSTTEYVRYIKLKLAISLFNENKYTIEQVTYLAGFSDPKYFRKCFKGLFGKSPSEYLKELKK